MTRPRPSAVAVAVLATAAAACSAPAAAPPAPEAPTATPEAATPSPTPSPVTPEQDALAALVSELVAAVVDVRADLEATAGGDDRTAEVVARLVAVPGAVLVAAGVDPDDLAPADVGPGDGDTRPEDDDGAGTGDDTTDPADGADGADEDGPADGGPAAVLPGPSDGERVDRVRYGDLLTRMTAAARGAGTAGEPVLRLLADPLAGDLGAWQRAATDQLTAIGAATAAADDLDAATPGVLALDGEVPRALAWAALGVRRPDLAPGAAERALAHLAVVEAALTDLLEA